MVMRSEHSLEAMPAILGNWIDGREVHAAGGDIFDNIDPATGRRLCGATRSGEADVAVAVATARRAQPAWGAVPAVKRGELLFEFAEAMRASADLLAETAAIETGKSLAAARGEAQGAIQLARFMAGEGQRLYGRTTTSGTPGKQAMTVRQPIGVAGLIVASNTPIANVAWKLFPALICGNAVVLKAAEDSPATAWLFGKLAQDVSMPAGTVNIIQGFGPEAGAALVAHPEVEVVSFTGSSAVGIEIASTCARSLKRVSLECGGKNPFVVCDDADLDLAVKWGLLSAFSNAGQRCASGSRMIVFDGIYEAFVGRMVEAAQALKLGVGDDDNLGPVINGRQLDRMIASVGRAKAAGGRILCGGGRSELPEHAGGFYMTPTLVEGLPADAELSTCEVFGPIATLYRVEGYEQALELANNSAYGLTACIHTRNVNRAMDFAYRVSTGVAVVNAGTFGSEPHMPFGGRRLSGNGSREPGTEALAIYSELKDIYLQLPLDVH